MGISRTAVNPSLEAAGKTFMFFTLRDMPIRSDLATIGVIHEWIQHDRSGFTTMDAVNMAAAIPAQVMNTKPLFKLMVDKKASDLFFTCNAPVKIKIEGQDLPG